MAWASPANECAAVLCLAPAGPSAGQEAAQLPRHGWRVGADLPSVAVRNRVHCLHNSQTLFPSSHGSCSLVWNAAQTSASQIWDHQLLLSEPSTRPPAGSSKLATTLFEHVQQGSCLPRTVQWYPSVHLGTGLTSTEGARGPERADKHLGWAHRRDRGKDQVLFHKKPMERLAEKII